MIITKVRLKNWGLFKGDYKDKKNVFSFKTGINVLNLPPNNGKTILFDAIQWLISNDYLFYANDGPRDYSEINESNFEIRITTKV